MSILLVLVSLLFVLELTLSAPIQEPHAPLARRDLPKYVAAHFMVGNAYPYTLESWLSDISLAHQYGIDAFALNVGSDDWQQKQVENAYQAAQQSGTGFKLFLSFDMTSLPCTAASDAATLRNYITQYSTHPNQLIYEGRVLASTFSGESCQFGQNSVQLGWSSQFTQRLSGTNSVHFIPAFFVDTSQFPSFSGTINGMFNWNSAWPIQLSSSSFSSFAVGVLESLATYVGTTTSDEEYTEALSGMDATYMTSVSPWFFTHYGESSYNKNWIYLSDDHLYLKRWESIINIRDSVDIVQVISWNDYGESHYIGPVEGAQPNSQAWVDGFDHVGWLKMTSYFATAFKTGLYPSIEKDQIYMWSRPHQALADAPDPVGRPKNYQLTMDRVWVAVFATASATVTLSTSSTESQTFNVTSGMTKLFVPISPGGYMQAVLERNDQVVINLQSENFSFSASPPSYNFNALVVSSS